MNRQELADLLAQTHYPSRPGMASSGLCNPSSVLSPRQKFQAHVRTLSDDSISSTSHQLLSPQRSPDLQHTSSLRVQLRDSPSPQYATRPSGVFRFGDLQSEPALIREEREAWNRASPSRALRGRRQDAYVLQPPEEESPAKQPSKRVRQLKSFAPSGAIADHDERPKTSRGLNYNATEEQDQQPRNSRFAEGSMNGRSAGVSSTWPEHSSISSLSGAESDNDTTPRGSPQRSSIDLGEFAPPAVTPATLRQRFFKIGSAFKSHEHTKTQGEREPHPEKEKKKKGLRKSISLWNIHGIGGKKKHGGSTSDLAPQATLEDTTLEVLNDRKRRAEEAYVEQFGPKRRKSNIGQEPEGNEQELRKTPSAKEAPQGSRRGSKTPTRTRRMRRSSSVEIPTDSDLLATHSDLDHHKRPSRRELEKENQQLRAMLRQQQYEATLDPNHAKLQSEPKRSQQHDETGTGGQPEVTPGKPSGKKHNPSRRPQDVPPVPPVPQMPERVVLKNLSNARNQPQGKNNTNNDSNSNANSTSNSNVSKDAETLKGMGINLLTSAPAMGLPRPVSIILEEDEEGENKSPAPQRVRRLEPSDVEKRKMQEQFALQVKGIKREQWEWPEDVF
ncbi:hypothetical protein HRR83_005749 [Exophiala dermatitidis]|uniref:Uncharacterized protein n=2 Tax=Exophiala dermatitidis TaxID=5970 RepID=H6BV79_EXODN|nr:uncharacterized protein HMPREF1120_03151 [Exophiala dermatitidis NIH/UT8656]KAJ4508657.1 hypothetical protein HRR73_007324 [Exophiala dermatitidis]EHY54993.1 hypothetical protein HMPREF1120_03151 [Exophiala dermatitidis NIH/UT8656]KAJ4510908.1 hypothetical protein HRR75_005602 [Exophiala dermatitidis]KAJ4513305.1 hypothetical protein HRR74_006117 [Exophiala dermatitidis]KAJ4538144.1 hypothetical protein HRR77_007184 [Exophiala dermatitidis]